MKKTGVFVIAIVLTAFFLVPATAQSGGDQNDRLAGVERGTPGEIPPTEDLTTGNPGHSTIIGTGIHRTATMVLGSAKNAGTVCDGSPQNFFTTADPICFSVDFFQAIAGNHTLYFIVTNSIGQVVHVATRSGSPVTKGAPTVEYWGSYIYTLDPGTLVAGMYNFTSILATLYEFVFGPTLFFAVGGDGYL